MSEDTNDKPPQPEPVRKEQNLEIYNKFRDFARQFSQNHPARTGEQLKKGESDTFSLDQLSIEEKELLIKVGSMDPEEFINFMTENPPEISYEDNSGEVKVLQPTYSITRPTQEDLDIVNSQRFIPEDVADDEKGTIEMITKNCAAYLRLPSVEDGFKDEHDTKRIPYRTNLDKILGVAEQLTGGYVEGNIRDRYNRFYTENALNANKQSLIQSLQPNLQELIKKHPDRPWAKKISDIMNNDGKIFILESSIKNTINTRNFYQKMYDVEENKSSDNAQVIKQKISELDIQMESLKKLPSTFDKLPACQKVARSILQIFIPLREKPRA